MEYSCALLRHGSGHTLSTKKPLLTCELGGERALQQHSLLFLPPSFKGAGKDKPGKVMDLGSSTREGA